MGYRSRSLHAIDPFLPKTNLFSVPTEPPAFPTDGSRYVSWMLNHALENHRFSAPDTRASHEHSGLL